MTTYQLNTQVQLTTVFTDDAGLPVDPTDVVLYLLPPGGTITQYTYSGSQVQRTAQGKYAFDVETALSGRWYYKWAGTNAAEVTSPDLYFDVATSRLIAG